MSSNPPSRREALGGLLALAGCSAVPKAGVSTRGLVLPPTAGDLETFLSKCIRCFRCGEVCTAGCIDFHGPLAGRLAGTPFLEPRIAACNVCMGCTQVCP